MQDVGSKDESLRPPTYVASIRWIEVSCLVPTVRGHHSATESGIDDRDCPTSAIYILQRESTILGSRQRFLLRALYIIWRPAPADGYGGLVGPGGMGHSNSTPQLCEERAQSLALAGLPALGQSSVNAPCAQLSNPTIIGSAA